jgi:hypothetical protein
MFSQRLTQNGCAMKSTLLTIDGIVNLVVGALLLLFPAGIPRLLGLPSVQHYFYTTVFGGVIVGIGLALFIELFFGNQHTRGLGLAGAIVINLCGGSVLLWWLVFKPFDLPMRGQLILWTVAILVLGIGLVEITSGWWKKE